MHELSIAQNILSMIEQQQKENHFSRVYSIRMTAGALSGIDPDSLRFAFKTIRQGTCADRADLHIDVPKTVLRCRQCGWELIDPSPRQHCDQCGSTDIQLDADTQFTIDSLEVE